jgi:hypothetical protein
MPSIIRKKNKGKKKMSRTLEAVTMDEATDWNGQILTREI